MSIPNILSANMNLLFPLIFLLELFFELATSMDKVASSFIYM